MAPGTSKKLTPQILVIPAKRGTRVEPGPTWNSASVLAWVPHLRACRRFVRDDIVFVVPGCCLVRSPALLLKGCIETCERGRRHSPVSMPSQSPSRGLICWLCSGWWSFTDDGGHSLTINPHHPASSTDMTSRCMAHPTIAPVRATSHQTATIAPASTKSARRNTFQCSVEGSVST